MPAKRIIHFKEVRNDGTIMEGVVWLLNAPVPPCKHLYKYRLYFGSRERCLVRYDNERNKGDHRHIGNTETSYHFVSIRQLIADFRRDLESWEAS